MRSIYTLGDYVFHKALNSINCSVIHQIARDKFGRIKYYGVADGLEGDGNFWQEPSFLGYEEDLFDSFEEAWAAHGAQITATLSRPQYNFAEALNRRIASGAPFAKEIRSRQAAEKRAAKEAEKARKKAEREAKKAVPVP